MSLTILRVGLAAALGFSVMACGGGDDAASGPQAGNDAGGSGGETIWTSWRSADGSVALDRPADWNAMAESELNDNQLAVLYADDEFSPTGLQCTLVRAVQPTPRGSIAQAELNDGLARMQESDVGVRGADIRSFEHVQISGVEVVRSVFTVNVRGTQMETHQRTFWLPEETGFTNNSFVCAGPDPLSDEDRETLETILNSLEINSPG